MSFSYTYTDGIFATSPLIQTTGSPQLTNEPIYNVQVQDSGIGYSQTNLKNSISIGNKTVSSVPSNPFSVASKRTLNLKGITYDTTINQYAINLIYASTPLIEAGVMKEDATNYVPELIPINFLETLGCTIMDNPGINYSLLQERTFPSKNNNPNIDGASGKSKKSKILTQNSSFKNENDPFYNSESRKKESVEATDNLGKNFLNGLKVQGIASYIADLNSSFRKDVLSDFVKPKTIAKIN